MAGDYLNPEFYAIFRIGSQEILIPIPEEGETVSVTHYRREETNGGGVMRQRAYALNLSLKGAQLIAA